MRRWLRITFTRPGLFETMASAPQFGALEPHENNNSLPPAPGLHRSFFSRYRSSLWGASTRFVTAPDAGIAPQINTYAVNGAPTGSFFGYAESFTGGVRVGLADVNGRTDIITGAGPGGGPHVKVFTGANNTPIHSFDAFSPNFNLGVFVAGGDVNGDGRADIIVGAGGGTGSVPHVKVFSGVNLDALASFFAFNTNFTGGVHVAAGDVNGDGFADIIVGSGPGASQVIAFSGKDLDVLQNFVAYPGFSGGVFVAAGDVNGDGLDDIITGAETGGPHVKVFSGKDGTGLQSFFAFTGSKGGVRVGATDLNGDGRADILASNGPGDPSRVRGFDGIRLSLLVDFAPYGAFTGGVFVGAIPRFPSQLLNISTRLNVLTDDNVLIGGFILTGTDPKTVIIRGIGPSSGVPGALADPTLELFAGGKLLASNNNWQDTQRAAIERTGIPPANDLESAIVETLDPGSYTAILRGNGRGTGIGLIEAYDLDQTADSVLANISSRGFVQSGDNVMIGGLILGGGTGVSTVLVRAIGPSSGVPGALADPTLGLYNSNGVLLRGNDDWRESQEAEIQATGIPPPNNSESALIALLLPGNYTAIVAGKERNTGIALVEVYNL